MFKLIATLIICFGCITFNIHAQTTDEFNLDEVYSIDPDGSISLESDDARVRITGTDREDVRVIVHYKLTVRGLTFGSSNKFNMIVEEQNGNLNIYERPRDFGSRGLTSISNEEYTIEIEAPRRVTLDIGGDDGEHEISGIDGSLRLKADDTDVQISDCNGDEFVFHIDDGSLNMTGGTGHLKIEADDGEVRINRGSFSDIDIDADDSDIEISTTLDDGGLYRFDIDDADLSLMISGGGGEFDIRYDDSDIETGSEFELIEKEDDFAIYQLMGGTARIVIASDDGDIKLEVI